MSVFDVFDDDKPLRAQSPTITPMKIPANYLATRRTIEAEISQYRSRTSQIGREINSLSPLSLFPAEVLAEIFIHYAMLYEEDEDATTGVDIWLPGNAKSYQWIGISHVCHHWREVAVSTPRLWARIVVHGKENVVNEVLARAKDAPLVVKAHLSTNMPLIQRFSNLYVANLQRIASLDLRIRGFGLGGLLASDKAAPLLRSFTFRDIGNSTGNWSGLRALFARELPAIERVSIRCGTLTWEPSIFLPTLKELKLECARVDLNNRRPRIGGGVVKFPTWAEMYDALRRVPRLQELDLENVFPVDPPGCEDSPIEPIQLPALRDLLVFGNARECADFLDHITLPLRCCVLVRITLDPGETPSQSVSAVRKQLEAWNRQPKLVGTSKDAESDPLRTLTISPVHSTAVLFRAWPIVLTDPSTVARLPVVQQEKLTLSLISEKVSAAILMDGFTDALLGSTLHTLCVENMEGITTAMWTKLLREMPNLHMLYFSQKSGEQLPAALGSQTYQHEPGKGGKATAKLISIVPHLRDLILDEVDFGGCLRGTSGIAAEFGARLRKALEDRKNAGSPLSELIITRSSNVRLQEINVLKSFVPLVDWDGQR